jgi:hypothetical protein
MMTRSQASPPEPHKLRKIYDLCLEMHFQRYGADHWKKPDDDVPWEDNFRQAALALSETVLNALDLVPEDLDCEDEDQMEFEGVDWERPVDVDVS